jgi:hypothetical protein
MFHVEHASSIRFWPSVFGIGVFRSWSGGMQGLVPPELEPKPGVCKRNLLGVDLVKTRRVFYELSVSAASIWRMT